MRHLLKITTCLIALVLLLSTILLVMPRWAGATEEYARQTGQPCASCHLDPGGGGELTASGKAFAVQRQAVSQTQPMGAGTKLLRLIVGYIHIVTAIFWFGTILYVHLILKPAYASSGLPRGEMLVGISSMIIMGITGTILTFYRITSFDMLLHTRFGILLLIKISLYLVMVVSAFFVVTVIGPRLKAKKKKPLATMTIGDLTLDELAAYDGKESRPAYFGYGGTIYDATHSQLWKQGEHMGRHTAGIDLTEALKLAPHGADRLSSLPVVGQLLATVSQKSPLHLRVFFFMAHMNLTIVFLIVLILALWRWA